MSEIIKGDKIVLEGLERLATGQDAIQYSTDSFGNGYHWFLLNEPENLTRAAEILKKACARLAMITAYNRHKDEGKSGGYDQNACYEFVLEGVVYSCTVQLSAEHPALPSITPIFANADWHEREMMELYGLKIINHPDPKRLFLDEELDKGLLGQIVPLSVVMNGASSTDLWERILSAKEVQQ